MNILIAADIFPPDIGGPATYAAQLAPELVRRGHRVKVVCYQSHNVVPPELSYPLKRIEQRQSRVRKYFQYACALLWRAIWADVIYAMGPVNAGIPALLVSWVIGRPLVVKVVGDYAWEQSCVQFGNRENIEHFQKTMWMGKIGYLKKAERLVASHARAVVVPSIYLQNLIMGWRVRKKRVHLIYNAYRPLQRSAQLSHEEAQGAIGIKGIIILTVARLVPWKNSELFIDIWPALLRKYPRARLVIVGDGVELDRLTGLVAERGLESSVFLIGRLSKQELERYYTASDIFALNSGYEGLSHVLLEALAHKLTVIASNIGGNLEIIAHEKNGILVPYNARDAWFDALDRLLGDPSLRQRFANDKGIDFEQFSFERMVDETEKLLLNVTEK